MHRTELPFVRLHDFRRTQSTLLIDAGVPVKVVSERLCHTTAAFTIETYQHVLPSMQTRAVARLMTPPVEVSRLKNRRQPA